MKRLFLILSTCISLNAFALSNGPQDKQPCGHEGSIEDRIKDCSRLSASEKDGFALVVRTNELKEIYKETKTGLFWGDVLSESMNHYEAEKACSANLIETANLSSITWRLPSKSEYEDSYKNGSKEALSGMNDYFWTATEVPEKDFDAFIFYGTNGHTEYADRNGYDGTVPVRCVGGLASRFDLSPDI